MKLFSAWVEECLTAQCSHPALRGYLHPHWSMMPTLPTRITPCFSQHRLPIWELLPPSLTNRRTEPTPQRHPTIPAQGALHMLLLRAPLIHTTVWGSPQTNTAVTLTSLPSQVDPHISPFGAATAHNHPKQLLKSHHTAPILQATPDNAPLPFCFLSYVWINNQIQIQRGCFGIRMLYLFNTKGLGSLKPALSLTPQSQLERKTY